ncbi:MAG: MBL fold metallo-hydrolase [bacterium]|nr:MBL fold metallo-hydrolase [bacterium]
MKLHQIRNATLILEYNGKRILIDPMFAPKEEYPPITKKAWPFFDLPMSPKDIIKNIDAVIITHLHIDHFDKFAQDILPKGIKIFVQDLFDKNALEKEHFNNIEIITSEGVDFEEIKLFKTDCIHGIKAVVEPFFLANGMRWEAMGVVFKSDNEPVLYLAGDTIWYDGVKEAIDIHKPKYIILNTSGAEVGMSEKIIMNTEDIKELHNYYAEGILIGSHMDNVGHAAISRADIRQSEVNEYIYLPADGELMYLE